MRIRKTLSAAALSVALAATFMTGSAGTASAAYSDCKAGWVCFWDYPGYDGAAWSAAGGPGSYSVGSKVAGKVSSVWNNSPYDALLYSGGQCGWISLPSGTYIGDMSQVACPGTQYATWNNKTTSVDIF